MHNTSKEMQFMFVKSFLFYPLDLHFFPPVTSLLSQSLVTSFMTHCDLESSLNSLCIWISSLTLYLCDLTMHGVAYIVLHYCPKVW